MKVQHVEYFGNTPDGTCTCSYTHTEHTQNYPVSFGRIRCHGKRVSSIVNFFILFILFFLLTLLYYFSNSLKFSHFLHFYPFTMNKSEFWENSVNCNFIYNIKLITQIFMLCIYIHNLSILCVIVTKIWPEQVIKCMAFRL